MFLKTGVLTVLATALLACSSTRESAAFTGWSYAGGSYEVQVVVNGRPIEEYWHGGRNWVLGALGDRYAIRVRNNTGSRVEVVATVDGLDVIDGKAGDFVHKRGYVIGPYQSYDIEGFRTSMSNVAAFRFSSVSDSYAARTGSSRNVGVIGVAFFAERPPVVYRQPPRPVYPEEDYHGWGGAGKGQGSAGELGGMSRDKAPSAGAESRPRGDHDEARGRRGLGTEFGERRWSSVSETSFVRANAVVPSAMITLYYNDYTGLVAMGVLPRDPPPDDLWRRQTANPFPSNPPSRTFATPPEGWYWH